MLITAKLYTPFHSQLVTLCKTQHNCLKRKVIELVNGFLRLGDVIFLGNGVCRS